MNLPEQPHTENVWVTLLAGRKFLVLDGGVASEIERRGRNIGDDPLWSARLLLDEPDLLEAIHLDYAKAGADILTTATYQASFPGLEAVGLSSRETHQTLTLAVQLARNAAKRVEESSDRRQRRTPLVAASIGPYGAHLADGSEYTGNYTQDQTQLLEFHRERIEVLIGCGVDLLACESIPSQAEGEVLAEILAEYPDIPSWISFTCRDALHVSHGELVVDCLAVAQYYSHVLAGVNCLHPHLARSVMIQVRNCDVEPVRVVYANKGDTWLPDHRSWDTSTGIDDTEYAACAANWAQMGAILIGGCCRTTPATTKQLALLAACTCE